MVYTAKCMNDDNYLPNVVFDWFTHRRRIKTEEKAKVVAAVWWFNSLKALDIFHQEDFEEKDE